MNDPNWRLEDWQIKSILDPLGTPVRALRWAWWTMPKRLRTEDGYKRITKIGYETFNWLRLHRDEYFSFLEFHKKEKEVYDKYIGKHEPEERITW